MGRGRFLTERPVAHRGFHDTAAGRVENTRSAAALMKQGYRLAGRYKLEDVRDGVYRDALLFDVVYPDWLKAKDAWNERTLQIAG